MNEKIGKIYDLTLRFLSFRPRSESEIKNFLQKHHATEKQKDIITSKLKKLNLINDENFMKWWIEQRQTFKQKGTRAIKIELRQKGISDDLIEKILEEQKEKGGITDLELAKKAAQKKYPYYKNLPRNEFYIKMGRFLVSRGFDWEIAKNIIDGFFKKE